MGEQNNDGLQHWESWTDADGSPGPAEPAGEPGTTGRQSPTTAFTQPISYPQGGYAAGEPGDGQPGYQAGGYGPPQGGYSGPGYVPPPPGFGPPPPGYAPPPGYGYGYAQAPRPRRRGLTALVSYLAVAALAATASGLVVSYASHTSSAPGASAGPGAAGNPNFGFPGAGQGTGNGFGGGTGNAGSSVSSAVVQKVQQAIEPGLVLITSNLQVGTGAGSAAAATGMIISKSGLVLTNNHVINGTTGLTATVEGTGRQYKAQWLGFDKSSDVAVIKLEGASGLTTVPTGNSSNVKVGDGVVGMGNAEGRGDISTATGSVTGLNQSITASDQQGSQSDDERLTGMIETNAQIVPGDSGGPLASTDGKVIGMDTAASTSSSFGGEQGQNAGYAIPINRALRLADQIIAGQSGNGVQIGASGFAGVLVPSGADGAQSTATDPQVQLQQQEQNEGQDNLGPGAFGNQPPQGECVPNSQSAGIPQRIADVKSGTLVLGSICDTPAANAGLTSGDVITKVGSQTVTSPSTLMSILQGKAGGSKVSMTWVTPDGQTQTRTLTLAAAPPS